ncbi:polysaccharide biosynthesis/export family protein [Methylocystis echinoides]|uniref:polysaccharide biosynthesis/export family protein n=1 Tax=Methylocystis echinoides TaxID=29468 RepID=UPI003420CA51
MKLSLHKVRTVTVAVVSAVIAGLGGCNGMPGDGASMASPDQPQTAAAKVESRVVAASKPGGPSYMIGPMDVVQITVFKAPDLSRAVPVAEDGTINLPLIGATPAAGKTSADLEREIQKRLDAGYMRSPQVTVVVTEYNSRRVTVEGAVKTPGVYPLRGRDTLEQAIAKAGGLDRNMASDSVTVFRNVDGQRSMIPYDLAAIRSGQADDPEVAPGDVIVVGDSALKVGMSYFQQLNPVGQTGLSVGQQVAR